MEIQEIIANNIAEWESLRDSNDIEGAIRVADELATNAYHLGNEVSDLYMKFNVAENDYKTAIEIFIFDNKKTMSKAAAESEAKVIYKDLKEDVIGKEYRYKKANLQLQQANKLLDSMRQRISYLRKEKENEAKYG